MMRVREIRRKVGALAWPLEANGCSQCLHETDPFDCFGHCWQLPASTHFHQNRVRDLVKKARTRFYELA